MKRGLSLKIVENNQQIQAAILNAMLPQIDSFMAKAKTYIQNNIADLISQAILEQPEYVSLVNGSLRLELGIPDADQRVAQLISVWINSIQITYQKPRIIAGKIKSSIDIKAIKSDFSDVLGLDASEVVDYNTGSVIPWLEWLLLEGTTTLVKDYEVVFGPSPRSRTGYAIMMESNSDWRVPSEYAGTKGDNWITRALYAYNDKINDLLKKALSQ